MAAPGATISQQETWTLNDPPALDRSASRESIDESACTECHADIANHYARNAMSKSWRACEGGDNLEGLPEGGVIDESSGYQYSVSHREGGVVLEETVLKPELRWGPGLSVRADYLIGSGTHAVALATRQDDYLHLLPVAFFTAENRWRMSPGYEAQNVRFSRPVTEGCIACHASAAQLEEPTLNRFAGPVVSGIGCRRCHGPGQEHVRAIRDGEQAAPNNQDLVNPSGMSPHRANDVCLQCHLQGIVAMHPAGRGPFTYRPGDRLSDHRIDYLVDGENPASFGVASHGARMMESRCYTASGGKLTCIHCHDPHRPASDFAAAHYDAKCQTCYGDRSSLPADQNHQAGGGCVGCHMPQRSTREGQHLVFTDHWVRRNPQAFRPEPSELARDARLRAVTTETSDLEKSKLGAAYVWLHEAIGPQETMLTRGVELLRPLVRSGRGDREDAFWLGAALLHLGRHQEKAAVLARLLDLEPNHTRGRLRLAQAYRGLGEDARADAELQKCLEQAPHWSEPYERLALAQLQRKHYVEAAATLQAELQQKESATAQIHLAVALIESNGELAAAQKLLERAAQLRPLDPTVQLNLAYLMTRKPDLSQAAIHYRRVLMLDPTNVQARRALEALQK